jgi:ABC-type lipoprotein release transport system permease subunit
MLTLRLGWRNLWRNGKRTAITMAAVSLNAAILIISYSLLDGLWAQLVSNATNLVTGEAQLHAPEYLSNRSFYTTVPRPQEVLASAARKDIAAAPRAYGFGLTSQGTKSAGALFWGIVPAAEQAAFDVHRHLASGAFFDPVDARRGPHRPMVLGAKLARSLNAAIGSEIVAVVQAGDGSLGNELFTVVGILKSVSEGMDRSAALITQEDFADLFVAPGVVHEIAFNSRGRIKPESIAGLLGSFAAGQDVRTWRQLLPQLAYMVDIYDVAIWIFGSIFFLAAALGVLNTMLMATFERIREFGVLKALGTSPWRIVVGVSVEAVLMVLASTLLGVAIALPTVYALQVHGLDMSSLFSSFTTAGVAFDPIWHAKLSWRVILTPVLTLWGVAVVAALWPATKAARINPVRAMTNI